MPPVAPVPGYSIVAEALRAAANGGIVETNLLAYDLIEDVADEPVTEAISLDVSPEVTTRYGQTGWDGDASFYITVYAGEKGAEEVRSFKVTVAETDHDDMPITPKCPRKDPWK